MRRALALLLPLACGPVAPDANDDAGPGSTTAAATTDVVITSLVGSSSATSEPMSTSTSTSTTSVETGAAASTGAAETVSFIEPTDTPGDPCDPWSQDCPHGMKCTWYADDGGSSWNNTKCVPVLENPAQEGEPCVAPNGGVGGIDDCDLGLMCWDVDAENQGYCIALCHGSPEDPFCDAPALVCAVYQDGFGLCLTGCDPLLQDCDPSDVCIATSTGGGFLCVLDASGDAGQQHDPCMYANACDPGLWCAPTTAAAECDQNATGCCQPFCDLSDPDADAKCGDGEQVCTPYYGDERPPPELADVGYCSVPI